MWGVMKKYLWFGLIIIFSILLISCNTSYKTIINPSGDYKIDCPEDWVYSIDGDWLEFTGVVSNDNIKFASSLVGDGDSYESQVQTLLIQLEGVEKIVSNKRYGDILISVLGREAVLEEDYTQEIIVCQVDGEITVVNSLFYPQSGDFGAIHDVSLRMIKSIETIK